MAQKPYKHNIEYIQKFYSYGSEAKVVEFKPVYKEVQRPALPKQEKAPVTTIFIDPVAFCGLMVAVVMLVVMLAGIIQFNVVSQDYAIMENYLMEVREENIILNQRFSAGYDLEEVEQAATTLGMIPVEQARTIRLNVVTPQRESEPTLWDDMVWFLSGLFE